jgi:hypothetical protein
MFQLVYAGMLAEMGDLPEAMRWYVFYSILFQIVFQMFFHICKEVAILRERMHFKTDSTIKLAAVILACRRDVL